MAEHPIPEQELLNRIYIGLKKTGDNVDAIRVLPYGFDGKTGTSTRMPLPFVPFAYDYVGIDTTSNSTSDVYTFYQGGSGGTLIATVTLGYSDSTKVTMTTVART